MATNLYLLVDSTGPHEGPRRKRVRHNLLKSLVVISFLGAPGCAGTGQNHGKSDVVAELRAENARLEEKITQLQEVDLKSARAAEATCRKENSSPVLEKTAKGDDQPTRSSNQEIEALPVVRLSPTARSDSEVDHNLFAPGPLAESEVEDDTSDATATRLVLKVDGAHEARVYHRPIEEGEEPALAKPD